MKKFKIIKTSIAIILLLGLFSSIYMIARDNKPEMTTQSQLSQKAAEARIFCEQNNLNTDFCVLVDMRIHSGKHRFFVWDFKQDSITKQALCAHGCGKDEQKSTGAQPLFSNVNGSLLTSLGKHKTGKRAASQYGINIHYKLHGLEPTNNNAYERIIVLHSFTPVPSKEIHPLHLPMGFSQGCPVIDNETMRYLDKILKDTPDPVLLWIYNE